MIEEHTKTNKIDLEQINSLIEAAGVAGAKEIMVAFWRSTESLMVSLDEHLATADYEGIKAAAHALKGSAANVGATNIAEFAKDVEAAACEKDLESAVNANDQLKDSVDEARQVFDKHISKREAA